MKPFLASTGTERHPQLPDVPTVHEAGLEKYDHLPGRLREPVVQSLEATLIRAVKHPDFVTYATHSGAEVFAISSKELSALVASDTARYRRFAKQLDAA